MTENLRAFKLGPNWSILRHRVDCFANVRVAGIAPELELEPEHGEKQLEGAPPVAAAGALLALQQEVEALRRENALLIEVAEAALAELRAAHLPQITKGPPSEPLPESPESPPPAEPGS